MPATAHAAKLDALAEQQGRLEQKLDALSSRPPLVAPAPNRFLSFDAIGKMLIGVAVACIPAYAVFMRDIATRGEVKEIVQHAVPTREDIEKIVENGPYARDQKAISQNIERTGRDVETIQRELTKMHDELVDLAGRLSQAPKR